MAQETDLQSKTLTVLLQGNHQHKFTEVFYYLNKMLIAT